jgi:flagellar basal-body rod protein FlgB
MGFNLDAELGVSAQALRLHARRLEVESQNIANADTPNFKARDIDFRAALADASERAETLQLTTTRPGQSSAASDPPDLAAALKYRVPLAPALDGNTVDVQLEQANFAETSVRYQASLSFVSDAFRGLMLAITGQ